MQIEQINKKQAYILTEETGAKIGVSYSTPQAVKYDGVTFITENFYSVTTSHHKIDILRRFNTINPVEVQQETINLLVKAAANPEAIEYLTKEILKEYFKKEELKDAVNGQGNLYQALKNCITIRQDRQTYKNGNALYKTTYKTNYILVSNVYIVRTIRSIKTKTPAFYTNAGVKTDGTHYTHTVKTRIKNRW